MSDAATNAKQDKLARLHEALAMVADARSMATTPLWAQAWDRYERELLERMLKCGPTDDEVRYRLQIGIEAARNVRIAIEHLTRTEAGLEQELDILEGRKKRVQDITR